MSEPKGEYSVENVLRFTAEVARVQTLADGGLRVILDLPQTAVKAIQELIAIRQAGAVLEIAAVPITLTKLDDATKKEPEGSGVAVDRRRSIKRRDKLAGS